MLNACERNANTPDTTDTLPTQTTSMLQTTSAIDEEPITLFYHLGPDSGLIKINSDGTGEEQIFGKQSATLNVVIKNGWIYYKIPTEPDGSKIHRLQIGSKKTQKISDYVIADFIIEDDWIYFTTKDNFHLYKIRTDGTEIQNITKRRVGAYCVLGNTAYFTVPKDFTAAGQLHCIGTDGRNEINLEIEGANILKASGNYLFYTKRNALYRMNVETLESTRALDYQRIYDVGSDRLMYVDNNFNLHVARVDGSDDTIIVFDKNYITSATIQGGKVYYKVSKSTGEGSFYSVNFDGSGKLKLPHFNLDSDGFGLYVNT